MLVKFKGPTSPNIQNAAQKNIFNIKKKQDGISFIYLTNSAAIKEWLMKHTPPSITPALLWSYVYNKQRTNRKSKGNHLGVESESSNCPQNCCCKCCFGWNTQIKSWVDYKTVLALLGTCPYLVSCLYLLVKT